jgi:hypothetical protein
MYVGRSADLLQTAVLEVIKSPEHGQPVKELCSIGLGRQGSKSTLLQNIIRISEGLNIGNENCPFFHSAIFFPLLLYASIYSSRIFAFILPYLLQVSLSLSSFFLFLPFCQMTAADMPSSREKSGQRIL